MGKQEDSDSDDDFFYYGTPLSDEAAQTQLRDRAPQDPAQTRAAPLHQQVRTRRRGEQGLAELARRR